MTRTKLLVKGSPYSGADRGLGRFERSMREMINLLASEGSIDVVDSRAEAHWSQMLTLEAVPYRGRRQVSAILDVIPLDMPRAYTKRGLKTNLRFGKAARSEAILTISRYSSRRIEHHYPEARGRVHVVPLPVPLGGQWPSSPGEYVLCMADYRAPDVRKRLHWIVQVAKELARAQVQMKIAVRGDPPVELKNTDAELVPDPSDIQLRGLMRDCLALVYTSAYEGQGLPPLEVLAEGAPVLAFSNTSLAEFLPDRFLLPDPHPWDSQVSMFPVMPQETLDTLIEEIRSYRKRDPAIWRPDAEGALAAVAPERVLAILRDAYRQIGVIV